LNVLDAKWIKDNGELKLEVVKPGKKFDVIDPGMRPYFFIPKKDYWDVKYLVNKRFEVDTDPGAETVDGRPVVKIEVEFPDQVRYLRDKLEDRGVETFESDIPFVKRWMIDNYITHGEIKTRAYVDIECDSRCVAPDSVIITNKGTLTIAEVVCRWLDGERDIKVLGIDDGKLRFTDILGVHVVLSPYTVEINNKLEISPNTPVLTDRGWVKGKDLIHGDSIYIYAASLESPFIQKVQTGVDEGRNRTLEKILSLHADKGVSEKIHAAQISESDSEESITARCEKIAWCILERILGSNYAREIGVDRYTSSIFGWINRWGRYYYNTWEIGEEIQEGASTIQTSDKFWNESPRDSGAHCRVAKALVPRNKGEDKEKQAPESRRILLAIDRIQNKAAIENNRTILNHKAPPCEIYYSIYRVTNLQTTEFSLYERRDRTSSKSSRVEQNRETQRGLAKERVQNIAYRFRPKLLLDLTTGTGNFIANGVVIHNSGFPDPEKAPARIIAISVVFNDGSEYFISDMDEKKMLQEFWDIMKERAEMVTGWNLRRFDWPYLINRSKHVLGGVPFAGVQELDAMFNFQKIVRWNAPGLGMKLDDIAYEFLGFRKLDDFENKEGIHALYNSFLGDKKLLYEYNMRDAKLVALLDEYLHLSDPYIEISKEFPIMLRETGYVSDIVEVLVLTTAQEVSPRIVFPRKKSQKAEIIGAITKEPEPGLHRNVMVLDFKSMYNAIIQAWYISPEIMKRFKEYYRKVKGRSVKWDDWHSALDFMREYVKFVKESGYEPIFGKFLSKVEAKREYAKKMRNKYQEGDPEFTRWQLAQFGFKLILVSTYGATGYSGARYFDEDTANAITFCGRWIITTGMKVAQELGFKVIYGDTDSFFIKSDLSLDEAKNLIDLIAMRIQNEIRRRAQEEFGPIRVEKLELEPKCIYSKLLLTEAKKVYWGKIVWEEGKDVEKKDVKGAAMKRSDRFELLGMVQDWITDLFFNTDADEKQLLAELEKLKQDIKNRLFAGEFDKYLVLRKNVRGDLDSYKADQPHIRVAKKLREMGLYRPGDAVKWVVVADGVEEPVIGDEIPKPTVSGYAYYWERIKDAIDRMTRPLIKAREVTLDEFFG